MGWPLEEAPLGQLLLEEELVWWRQEGLLVVEPWEELPMVEQGEATTHRATQVGTRPTCRLGRGRLHSREGMLLAEDPREVAALARAPPPGVHQPKGMEGMRLAEVVRTVRGTPRIWTPSRAKDEEEDLLRVPMVGCRPPHLPPLPLRPGAMEASPP